MSEFYKYKLKNQLNLVVYPDHATPMAAVDICYHVGAKHEDSNHTGFAHLFEHLMFGGSKNIPDFDTPLQRAGGDNNAYTTNDYTNYYISLPAENLETAFWLESDRMFELDFSPRSLEVQRKVVIEEFKQRNLNQPYGDVWALLRSLAYKVHPYQWPVIGKEIAHIEQATLEQVKDFFYHFYAPNNASIIVTGNVDPEKVVRLTEKWFAEIPVRTIGSKDLPAEPEQKVFREQTVYRDVPDSVFFMAFHMAGRKSRSYYICDLISDVLSNGYSSRLYKSLVREKMIFTELDAYLSGDHDPGLFVVTGKFSGKMSREESIDAVWDELNRMKLELVNAKELEKVKNKLEANQIYLRMNYLNMAQEMATFEDISQADLLLEQMAVYHSVSPEDIRNEAVKLFRKENCSQLNYLKNDH